jgi:hypothetical protein
MGAEGRGFGKHRPACSREIAKTMDTLFAEAIAGRGKDYLKAEKALRDGGLAAVPALRRGLNHADPMGQFLASCLLDWVEGRAPENQEALDYLETLPAKVARTQVKIPSPQGAASYLSLHFGPRVANILALRLVKGIDWPHWRIMGVLFYLREQKQPSTTTAVLRFASEIQNREWRDAAIDTIKALNDPQLRAKVAAERLRFQAQMKILPTAIADLETAPAVP